MRIASLRYSVPIAVALLLRVMIEPQVLTSAPMMFMIFVGILALITWQDHLLPWQGELALRWHAAGLFVLGVNGGYQISGRIMAAANGWRADNWLHSMDRQLLGGSDVQYWLAVLNAPWLSDLLALAYVFFLVLLPLVSLYYIFFAGTELLVRYWQGLMLVYGIGFAGYLILPAAGPYLHHPGQLPQLEHGFISRPLHAAIADLSTGVDVWPSLHCAVTLYIQLWLWREAPRLGRLLLLPSALVVLSTMYLQYHYLIDVIAGVALAWAAISVIKPQRKTDVE